MPRHAGQLDQIWQICRKPTGRFMPQVVKAQIDQKVFLRRDLRYVAISQVFQPRTLQTPDKGLLERISRGGKDSTAQRAWQVLQNLDGPRRKRDSPGQSVLRRRCAVLRSRFTCFQHSSKISPRRMAVSIANWTMGRI